MLKLKPIRPSLKEKKRYVVFSVIAKSPINQERVFKEIQESCLKFMGILSFSKAGLIILKNQYDSSINCGILRINNRYVDHLKVSLMMITKIDGIEVNIIVKGVSGILKKVKEKFMK
ncbi:MAG: Rpp14/Pop5 family protein [Candidatus Woesearchaeota archaeon]